MPVPISVKPPRPGDGSKICEPRRSTRERRERQERRAAAAEAVVEDYMKEAYPPDEILAEREPRPPESR
jgi:hypothetical protein